MNITLRVFLLLACLGIVGCAGVDYQTVRLQPMILNTTTNAARAADIDRENERRANLNAEKEAKLTGIRYYKPATYLLVYSDGKESLKWEIHYLPEPTVKASAAPYNFVASLQATLQFNEKGILTSVDETADSAAFPKAAIAAAEKLAATVADALMNKTASERLHFFPSPKVLKFDGVGSFYGGESMLPVLAATPKSPEK